MTTRDNYTLPEDEVFRQDSDIAEPSAHYRTGNHEMNLAWQFVARTGISVFLTGKAGTGKTTFLHRLRQLLPKRMVVLAPTGVAAINAQGQTIHSFFQMPFGPYVPGSSSKEDNRYKMSETKKKLIRTLDLLVIDEVSMVRADLMDRIDDTLRRYRNPSLPFGGVQLLLIGDLMQLSPVVKNDEWALLAEHYDSPYFYSSQALKRLHYVTVELKQIYRQQDMSFIGLLGRIRDGVPTAEDIAMLNARYVPGFCPQEDGWIRLTTHNATAAAFNASMMRALNTPERTYTAEVSGDFPESSYPADLELTLKPGAQVMFIKQDASFEKRYYNGKIGKVVAVTKDYVDVACKDSREPIRVEPVAWENNKYSLDTSSGAIREEVAGTFMQLPLRPAWAITVHKSQGLTFDRAILDINSSFTHGQTYVALSRCRTLEGMVLANPIDGRGVITDHSVCSYIDGELARTPQEEAQLGRYKVEHAIALMDEMYTFSHLLTDLSWLCRVVNEHLYFDGRQALAALEPMEGRIKTELVAVAAKFRPWYAAEIAASWGNLSEAAAQRIRSSCAYFAQRLRDIFAPLSTSVMAIPTGNKRVAAQYADALSALRTTVKERTVLHDAMSNVDFSPKNYLEAKAAAIINSDKGKTVRGHGGRSSSSYGDEGKPKKPPRQKGETVIATLKLLQAGKTPEDVAKIRGLVESTIYTHIAQLAMDGQLDLRRYVSEEEEKAVFNAIDSITTSFNYDTLRGMLPTTVSDRAIRLLLALHYRHRRATAAPISPAPDTPDSEP